MPDNPEDYDRQLAGMREMINTIMPPEEKVATVKALATTLEMMAWFYREMPKLLKEKGALAMIEGHDEQTFDLFVDVLMLSQIELIEETLRMYDAYKVEQAQALTKATIDMLMAPQIDVMRASMPDLRSM